MSIEWNNFIDEKDGVIGYAIVKKGYKPYIHSHPTDEIYHFIKGTGKLYLNGDIHIISSPNKIFISKNTLHAMTAITDDVLIIYELTNGPFKNINKYVFFTKKYNYKNISI